MKPDDWTRVLRDRWDDLAASPYRGFFVASHRGWDDPATWQAQAEFDAAIAFHGISPGRRRQMDVLEIGCGVGRLAQVCAPQVRSYTGFDISAAMVEEARQKGVPGGSARFFTGDGMNVPREAADRRYDLIFALAVFIHLPRVVIASLLASSERLLAHDGELRFQLRADRDDPTGIEGEAPALECAPPELRQGPPSAEELLAIDQIGTLAGQGYYMGDAFRYDEVEPFVLASIPGSRVKLHRYDPEHVYVHARRQ